MCVIACYKQVQPHAGIASCICCMTLMRYAAVQHSFGTGYAICHLFQSALTNDMPCVPQHTEAESAIQLLTSDGTHKLRIITRLKIALSCYSRSLNSILISCQPACIQIPPQCSANCSEG